MTVRPRPIRIVLLLAALACLVVLVGSAAPGPGKRKGVTPVTPTPVPAATWNEVDLLVKEQKFEQAAQRVGEILRAARARRDEAQWTKALIREVQLRMGLHGYEIAVRFLKDEPWPAGLLSRAALELFYAQSLIHYAQAYSWEVSQRERVESSGTVDLKAWTREQIYEEANRAYLVLWRERDGLGRERVRALDEFVAANGYPTGIRDTLRDAVTYLYAALLADTAGWSPAQSNGVFALDLSRLLSTEACGDGGPRLDDPAVHPLTKLVAVLADLEGWHAGRGDREAAFEARLERLRRLFAAFPEEADRGRIGRDLAARLPAMASLPWFSMGKAQLAEFVEQGSPEGDLVRARAIAEEGRLAYPGSLGGQRCLAIVCRIEAPAYQVRAMSNDGPGRRSILVAHKNVIRLAFRAYTVDLESRIAVAKNANRILPDSSEIAGMVDSREPVAQWEVTLHATPDFRLHSTYVVPPMRAPGLYLVAASGAPRFGGRDFPLVAATFLLSDLVLVLPQAGAAGPEGAAAFEIQALSGEAGRPVAGASVTLYRSLWNPERIERIASKTTGADGLASLAVPRQEQWAQRFVVARRGRDLAFDPNASFWTPPETPSETTSSLVFTDRAIYRPLQKVLWKALAYRGNPKVGHFEALPDSPLTVTLVDQNNQKVESRMVSTNAYGSASGEFAIPQGRALGAWRVETSLGGPGSTVRVEEYKRPTFEVTLKDPVEPLRLNRPARISGEARYYFGLPVASGAVRWRVTRTPQYPWWFWWRGWPTTVNAQTVAAGTSALAADGTFTLAFTPAADERLSADAKELTYSYLVEADASDQGGETRSASRSFRLGFVSVEARIELPGGFVLEGARANVRIVRTSLDGVPRAGQGSWRIVRLKEPEVALLPSEEPILAARPPEDAFRTAGDLLRPRWDHEYAVDRAMARWGDGEEVANGVVTHDAKGEATVVVPSLPAGAYRLRYRTVDEFGSAFEIPRELVVGGKKTSLMLPGVLLAESNSVPVGGMARLLVVSGLPDQTMFLDIDRDGARIERRELHAGRSSAIVEIPIGEKDRGGFGVKLTLLRDHQLITLAQAIFVPWDDKELEVSFATFRDRLRPGEREVWRVKVDGPDHEKLAPAAAELLAYMYDRSLDAFAYYQAPSPLSLYPNRTAISFSRTSLGETYFMEVRNRFPDLPPYPYLGPDVLRFYGGYSIGGPGRRGIAPLASAMQGIVVNAEAPMVDVASVAKAAPKAAPEEKERAVAPSAPPAAPVALRSAFAETAFWQPHLLTGADGSATIEFTVPDSVTAWNVWVHAVTKDLQSGSAKREARSVKELMVRPYVPRFLREGDTADLKVVVNNASDHGLSGHVTLDILDTESNRSALSDFGLAAGDASRPFAAAASAGADVVFRLSAPKRVGSYAVKATAVAGDFSDGELRPVPVLPGRMQLAQSRFVTLREGERRTMTFADMAKVDDPSRIDEQLVVTVDAQLFYSVLSALPYLVNYPYECTEQTLNRFVSTGIVSSLFRDYPAVAKMAQDFAKRDARLETWDANDPNRRMALEETPWLEAARGGSSPAGEIVRVLDPRVAAAEREASLAKLANAQTESGGFPWWPGGPPSPYMTLYILGGFAHALEFGGEVPKDMVQKAWAYAGKDIREDLARCMHSPIGLCEMATLVNFTLSSYPDSSWYAGAFDEAYRRGLANYSFERWKMHSPYLKGQLALTLNRMGRPKDARLVWASVMDSAKTDRDLGTHWAPEDRAWFWYNDTIETQAFALRTLMELEPSDARRHGLVQWLFLNKKLNQWKSTRATAEVLYALVWYLKKEGALAAREEVAVEAGGQRTTFSFEPDRYTGKRNQVVIPGEKIDPKSDSTIAVSKGGKGLAFASATWNFSTEKLPEEDRGDFFGVSRKYFLRESTSAGFVLKPLAEGVAVATGDEVEVQVSLRSKHAAEYVHLRDPRAAGLEPENVLSRHKWDLGIGRYEETRDSGSNFFFEWLPAGEYTFKYRLRANMAGTFKVGPATVQSMYAPEFSAYSAGATITVR